MSGFEDNYRVPLQETKPSVVRNLFQTSVFGPREPVVSYDRFIPCRANNNWITNFATIPEPQKSSQVQKKARETGESPRESSAYNCLLKNELLGENIEDIKTQCDERQALTPVKNKNLFRYGTQVTPTKVIILFCIVLFFIVAIRYLDSYHFFLK